ncbi:hypothetical protein [Anabaena cylindrica]|nr:hypothetical protein [Anabaena cylindrica]
MNIQESSRIDNAYTRPLNADILAYIPCSHSAIAILQIFRTQVLSLNFLAKVSPPKYKLRF